jgi:methylenetetrahydrofolate dehydrogenase (NADP+)/methenyltetrahydrofolate cyclohydrolase
MLELKGAPVAKKVRDNVAREAKGKGIGLAIVLVGNDPASHKYVSLKEKACVEVGIKPLVSRLPEETTQKQLLALIRKLNRDARVNGIIVQLPLPAHLGEAEALEAIKPLKDVDCLHPENMGKLFAGDELFAPATPKGIITLLEHYGISVAGTDAVVIGRSRIVGRPMAAMLTNRNATVTVCHSKTKDLAAHTRDADIIVTAVGKPRFLTKEMVRKGAVVVDVGTTVVNGKVVGDAHPNVAEVAGALTPVPGGVGPMTIATLLESTLAAAKLQQKSVTYK